MSNSKRIRVEKKIQVAKACIDGNISVYAAAEQLGVHHSAVNDWVRLYETEGIESLLPREENRRYDPLLKEAAVKDYLSGRDTVGRCICNLWLDVWNGCNACLCGSQLYSGKAQSKSISPSTR